MGCVSPHLAWLDSRPRPALTSSTGSRSFEERGEAFDFNVALQDFLKHLSAPLPSTSSSAAASKPAEPKKDFSLKEGQTFSIAIPGGGAGGRPRPAKKEAPAGGGGLFALPPPPPPASRRRE